MIILIVGDFGVGKDTFADFLVYYLDDAVKIKSYTSRAPRFLGEDTHIFKSKGNFIEDYSKHVTGHPYVVAWTIIHNEYYWTTIDQFNKHKNEVYIVDSIGLCDVIKSQLFNDLIVLKIVRSKELIDVGDERLNRERLQKKDYDKYVNLTIENNSTIQELEEMAKHIASIIE